MDCIRTNINITIVEGGTFDQTFKWSLGESPKVPVDLTGYTAKMQVRAKAADVIPLIDVTDESNWAEDVPSGIYFYEQTSPIDDRGKFRMYFNDTTTLGICAAHKDVAGVYDCFLYNPQGEAVHQLYGAATLIAAVSR